MKIALVQHTGYPDFIGGREHHVHNLASILSKSDEVVIIAGGKDKGERRRELGGYTFITLPMLSIKVSNNPLQIYRIILKLFSCLKKEKPDIIHAFEYGSYSTNIACIYSKKYNIPFILTIYGYQLRNPLLKFMKIFYDYFIGRPLLNRASKIFYPSDTQRQEVLRIYKRAGVEDKMVLQANCIKIADYNNLIIKKDLLRAYNLGDEIKLTTVARILPRKGVKYLIFALEKAIKEYKIENIRLIIIGPDCGEAGNIKKIIKSKGLEGKVVITGPVPYERIKDFLAITDIFVLPSLYEGLPLSLLEAMASGKAVIFTDIPCVQQVIKHEKEGLLVKPADAESLVNAIVRLCFDNKIREFFGYNAKRSIESFDSCLEAERTKKAYAQVLGNRSFLRLYKYREQETKKE